MDIVANNLSVSTLAANSVKIKNFDIKTYFESKLSDAVNFKGVYDSLSDIYGKNGDIVIVGSKEYIFSQTQNDWREIGDESLAGQLAQHVADIDNGLSNYALQSSLDEFKENTRFELQSISSQLSDYATVDSLEASAQHFVKDYDISCTIALCSESDMDDRYMQAFLSTQLVKESQLDGTIALCAVEDLDERYANAQMVDSVFVKSSNLEGTVALCSQTDFDDVYMHKDVDVVLASSMPDMLSSFATYEYIDEKIGMINNQLEDILN